ncbi:MAG: alpha-amylase family glycosyl hydrolase [Chitinophagaceae bacterium]
MRRYMTDALKYWVRAIDIDGYRCDVAGFVPIDFWENARQELDLLKPVFMLAEWESRDLHRKAFDMTYSWSLWDEMKDVTTGKKDINGLLKYLAHDVKTFPNDAYRMTFTDNHDKNAWEGNQFSYFGEGLKACMIMAGTVNGMPLVYNGQEAGLNHSLKFFDKDLIEWKQHDFFKIYKTLFEMKHKNQALWNGAWGGEMVQIFNDKPTQVISFSREKNNNKVISIINFSDKNVTVTLHSKHQGGVYKNLFTETVYTLKDDEEVTLAPWCYLVLVK